MRLPATALVTLLLAACGDNETPIDTAPRRTTVRFAARMGTEPLACGQTYAGVGANSATVELVDLRFYVHDVHLVKQDGSEVALQLEANTWQHDGVALLDFENGTEACANGDSATNTELVGLAPPGPYAGLRFRVGVPSPMNHQDLTSLPAPLNKSGLYWSWRSGRIFLSAVTRAGANSHFTHVGATGCDGDPANGMPVTSCAKPNRPEVTLQNFDPTERAVAFDVATLKSGVNVTDNAGCHSFQVATCPAPFAALGLDFATGGAATVAQTAFRVE